MTEMKFEEVAAPKPKTSFLIDDILQTSPKNRKESVIQAWPAKPVPVYNSPLMTHATTPQCGRNILLEDARVPVLSYSVADPYRGLNRSCWTMMPSYSLSLFARHFHNKRKGGQVRFSSEQTAALERRFGGHKYLSPEERKHLATQLKLSDRQVKTWFQNRRAKWRRANQTSSDSSQSQSVRCNRSTSSPSISSQDVSITPPRSPLSIKIQKNSRSAFE